MNELCYFYPEGHESHFAIDNPERPARIEAILQSLDQADLWDSFRKLSPTPLPSSVLRRVHSDNLIRSLQNTSGSRSQIDSDTYVTTQSWDVAFQTAGGTAAVAKHVMDHESLAGFALSRPPGHHATPDQAMGFCLLNNVALAAEYVLRETSSERIAIIDIDVHHGNGTQDIFYQRDDVLFISIHQLPLYPGTGHVNETGRGKGTGFTLNIPMPPYSGDDAREAALHEVILPALTRFAPDMLLVSAGFDAHWRDPLAHQLATAGGYYRFIRDLSTWAEENCRGRMALTLEGGYDLNALASCATACASALLASPFDDPLGASTIPSETSWRETLEAVKRTHHLD